MSAVYQFCESVIYTEDSGIERLKTLGVSKEYLPGKINVSCIKAEWSGVVTIEKLREHEEHCTLKHGG